MTRPDPADVSWSRESVGSRSPVVLKSG